MKALSLILCLVLTTLLAASAQTQSEMNEQAGKRLQTLDAKLNKVYQAKLKEHADDPQYLADLREAQRAWLKYVEFHLKTVFPLPKGENPREVYGSMYPLDFAEHKSAMIERRIEELSAAEP